MCTISVFTELFQGNIQNTVRCALPFAILVTPLPDRLSWVEKNVPNAIIGFRRYEQPQRQWRPDCIIRSYFIWFEQTC